ncbi:MAG: hypothetical protein CO119_07735 [Flavobacteriales bacterium CG_4_9_14_3_um_filter_40_17]|nr:MAG: hypothetical protein CO119_07735 [Flavobacteriales bacterium CG_4_9_14_3_um_filter_40_17]
MLAQIIPFSIEIGKINIWHLKFSIFKNYEYYLTFGVFEKGVVVNKYTKIMDMTIFLGGVS